MRFLRLVGFCVLALFAVACSSGAEDADESSAAPGSSSSTTTIASTVASSTSAAIETEDTTTTTEAEADAATTSTTTTTESPALPCGLVVTVAFDEGAPRDRMTISNASTGDVSISSAVFDLSTSAGNVIFDTLDGGSGVEVFQDFQVEAGDAVLAVDPVAEDGGSQLGLDFDSFTPAQSFTFSIDVDDQLADSDLGQIQVTGSELAGATVTFTAADETSAVAEFGENDTAEFIADC